MMRDAGRSARWVLPLLMLAALTATGAEAAVKPRAVLVVAFDSSALERDEQWVGQGIAEILGLGLDQHPAFIQIEDSRVRAVGRPDVWGEAVVAQTARTLRVGPTPSPRVIIQARNAPATTARTTSLTVPPCIARTVR